MEPGLEGYLLVPPERSQILGRAVWKPRYVVIGRRNSVTNPSLSQVMTTSRIQGISPRPKPQNDEVWLTVYKSREDWEPVMQYPLASVADCDVRMVAHRKQGPVLPTLVINISDKGRKRRSSRAAGLISAKESSAVQLWFRNPPDDHHPSLHEWVRIINARKPAVTPESPVSPSFFNPFSSTRSRDASDGYRPSSGSHSHNNVRGGGGGGGGGGLHHKSSTNYTHSSRDRDAPNFSSESPSLRSRRSDISSPSSAQYPPHAAYAIGQAYGTPPASGEMPPEGGGVVVDDYNGDFIEGWTAAQGRGRRGGGPMEARGSVSSQAQSPTAMEASSPPGHRETILDRAFQMRYIPGSEQSVPGEEKLSSLARFDALMREAEGKRLEREARERAERRAAEAEAEDEEDEESTEEEDDDSDEEDEDDEEDDEDLYIHDHRPRPIMSPNAQRALEFIASRHEPTEPARPPMSRTPVSFAHSSRSNRQAPSRPHTAHAKSRPSISQQRTQSHSHLAQVTNSPSLSRFADETESTRTTSTSTTATATAAGAGAGAAFSSAHVPRNSVVMSTPLSPPLGINLNTTNMLDVPTSSSSPRTPAGDDADRQNPHGGGGGGGRSHSNSNSHSNSYSNSIRSSSSTRSSGGGEKRASSSSAKRLSITEFTKRLSSSSSLLIVQTNAAGGRIAM